MIASASKWWLLENASSHDYGIQGDTLINLTHIFMLLLFVGWGIYFVYCLFRFRASKNPKATYEPVKAKISKYIEVAVVIFEGFLLLGLSIPAWSEFKNTPPEDSNATVVHLKAQQFQWDFHYAGADGIFGATAAKFFNPGDNPIAVDRGSPHGLDDIWFPGEMTVPVNKPVVMKLSSWDVIHSFGIPKLRVKQDIIPGMAIPIWFQPAKIGKYEIVCSQLCGNGHYRMKGTVNVVSAKDYERWTAERVAENREEFEEEFQEAEGTAADVAPTEAEAPSENAQGQNAGHDHSGHDHSGHKHEESSHE